MLKAENPEVRTRDKIEIELGKPGRTDFMVKLSGELDVHDLRTLHETLGLVLSTGLWTIVDLSDVTFLDVRCARELVVRSRLYDHLFLHAPSWQAKASLKACGREARVVACLQEGLPLRLPRRRAQAQQHTWVEQRRPSAVAV